jgi:hypothetical protein
MRKTRLLVGALFALLALGAVVASSAFAGEWLVNGEALTENLPAETEGELALINLPSTGSTTNLVKILCSGIFDGWIGPEGKDLIEDLLDLEHKAIGELEMTNETPLSCTVVESAGGFGDCALNSLAELWVDNLNLELKVGWATQIELMSEGTVLDHLGALITEEDKLPGYDVRCKSGLLTIEQLCEGLTSTVLSNAATTPASVLGVFNAESEPANCAVTGNETGTLEGEEDTWAVGGTVAAPEQLNRLPTAVS